MKRSALIPAIALAGAMALPIDPARAWDGGAVAAGAIGGLAAGALIGAAATNAYGYPAYGYGYAPARAYAYEPAYVSAYAEEPVVHRRVVYREPAYRVVRRAPVVAYDPAPYRWGSTWGPTVRVGYGYGPSYGYGYRDAAWGW